MDSWLVILSHYHCILTTVAMTNSYTHLCKYNACTVILSTTHRRRQGVNCSFMVFIKLKSFTTNKLAVLVIVQIKNIPATSSLEVPIINALYYQPTGG